MRFIFLLALALSPFGLPAHANEPEGPPARQEADVGSVDYSRPSKFTISWSSAPADLEQRDRAIQPLIKQGFDVAVNLHLDERIGKQTVSYTLTRVQVQSEAELNVLLSNFVAATQRQGKVSSMLSQKFTQ